jgi:hypothetical protein
VAVAVVALPIGVPLAVGRGDRPHEETPVPAILLNKPCPTDPVNTAKLGPVPALGDVVAVRSCPVRDSTGDPLPAGPLFGVGARAFAADVTALPAYRCLADGHSIGQPWALQLQKTDGELVTIGGTERTCAVVRIGGVDRGVEQVVAAFEGNLDRQQSGIPELGCPTGDRLADGAPTWNASFDPATATAGVVCFRGDQMGAHVGAGITAALDSDQLATIVDDLASGTHSASVGSMCFDSGPQRLLVLEDADGDQAAFADDRCTGEFAGARGYWTPSAAAEQAFAGALNR